MSDDKYQSAAIMADSYLEIILSTSPELLVANITEGDEEDVQDAARRLAIFRSTLVEEFLNQPLAAFDEEDELEQDDED